MFRINNTTLHPPLPHPQKGQLNYSPTDVAERVTVELMMVSGRRSTPRAVLIKARIERDSNRLKVYIQLCRTRAKKD